MWAPWSPPTIPWSGSRSSIELLDELQGAAADKDFPEALDRSISTIAEGSAPWRRLGGFLEPDPEKGCSVSAESLLP